MPRTLRALQALSILTLITPAVADSLVTVDGRVIEVGRVKEEGDNYRLLFDIGEVLCPKSLVASVEIEGDMSDYEPKNDKERKFLEDGYVRYKNKWMSKAGYERELEKKAEESRARTAEIAKHKDFSNAWEKVSKHFVVRSNTSEELLEHYTEMLEAYYSLMDDRIGIKPTPTMKRTKMTVNIFKNIEELHAHSKRSADEEEEEEEVSTLLGYFSSTEQSLNFYHDYKDPGLSQITALHECTHLLTYLIDQDYLPQIWINEAVAEYFGTANISRNKRGKMVIDPGQPQTEQILTMQEAIAAGNYTPLTELFELDHDTFDGFQYANAWSFVYFLQNRPKYAKPFRRYFKELYTLKLKGFRAETIAMGFGDKTGSRKRYTPDDVRDALLKAIKVRDLAALEKEWLEFVKALPLNGAEARFKRGYASIFSGGGTAEQALSDLNTAVEEGYETAECYRARAYAKFLNGDWAEARTDMEQAVRLNPIDGVYRAELGWLLTGWFGGEGELIASPEEMKLAELNFGLATLLDPENDEWRELNEAFLAKRSK